MIKIQATYLLTKLPNIKTTASHEIKQAYLTDDAESLRVRKKGNTCYITRKIDMAGGSMEELDMPILEKDFEAFWIRSTRNLANTRYYYSDTDGVNIRIDVFHDKLEGLALAEVIFDSEEVKKEFKTPNWFGREISNEKWASNQYFAGTTFEALKAKIG